MKYHHIILITSIFLFFLSNPVFSQTISDDPYEEIDIDFIFEVVDNGFCEMPPAEFSDDEIIGMIDMQRDQMPVKGTISGDITGDIFGSGYFKLFDDGVRASFNNMIITENSEVFSLCLAVVPVAETTLTHGTADLVGHLPDAVNGETYITVGRISERTGSDLNPISVLHNAAGSLTFSEAGEEVLEGSFELSGQMLNPLNDEKINFTMQFSFMDMLSNPLGNLRLGVED